MTHREKRRQLNRLLNACWDGPLSCETTRELNAFLRDHPECLLEYVEAIHTRSDLIEICRLAPGAESAGEAQHSPPEAWEGSLTLSDQDSLAGAVLRGPAIKGWAMAAAAVLAIATLFAFRGGDTLYEPVDAERASADLGPSPLENTQVRTADLAAPGYVGQLTAVTSDAVWGTNFRGVDGYLRIKAGDSIQLQAGKVEVQFFAGASIVLTGPVDFVPTGPASGQLLYGSVAGEVSDTDFLLTTPTAQVVDLGTSFGVSVDEDLNTDVHVFEGRVKVYSTLSGTASKPDRERFLTEGMTVRVASGGTIEFSDNPAVKRLSRALNEEPFFRPDDSEISVLDLLIGRAGKNCRLAAVIDPVDGGSGIRSWRLPDGPGQSSGPGSYQEVPWHGLVDGVFIPSMGGKGVRIDSAGHRFDFPANTGKTWGPVWFRRRIASPSFAYRESSDFWGTSTLEDLTYRLQKSNHGLMGLHSNVGITVDLEAVRALTGKRWRKLTGIVGNLNNAEAMIIQRLSDPVKRKRFHVGQRFAADFRLIVDGKVRFERLDFSRDDGELEFSVPIHDGDRFVTLATTDGDASTSFDHVVVLDPVLHCE